MTQQAPLFIQMFSSDENSRVSAKLYFRRATQRSMPDFWLDEYGETRHTLQIMWVLAHPEKCIAQHNGVYFMYPPNGLRLDLIALVDWLRRALIDSPIIDQWYPHLAKIVAPDISSWQIRRD